MPESLRALVIVLVCAMFVFAAVRVPACGVAMRDDDFRRRRVAWFVVTLAAFLSYNFWIFIVTAGVWLVHSARREGNAMALYFFLLFAVPSISSEITGLGIVQHFFAINWLRLLSMAILLPAWLVLRRDPRSAAFGSLNTDRFLLAFLAIALLLQLTVDTFTNTLRFGLYAFLDVFLPYYVASRSLRTLAEIREALMAFVIAALLMVPVALFEFARTWLLYGGLNDALGVPNSGIGSYLMRDDLLRAMASVQHPIALGYVMALALGLLVYLRRSVQSGTAWMLAMAALVAGLLAPVSRGPWLGALAIAVTLVATGPDALRRLLMLGIGGAAAFALALLSPFGDKLIGLLPFIGDVETENIDYRHRLLEVAVQLIADNPWFGAFDYMYSAEIQELKQGQGIIDIVNTYVAIGLNNGLVGLSMFVLFFTAALLGVLRGMVGQEDRDGEVHLLGQTILACVAGILLMIFTVSSISVIPAVYWSMGGVCVAYAGFVAGAREGGAPVRDAGRGCRVLPAKGLDSGLQGGH